MIWCCVLYSRYTLSRAKSAEEAFGMFWEEVKVRHPPYIASRHAVTAVSLQVMLCTTPKEYSTVLLVFPEIELFGNYELFEGYCDSLSDALCSSTMCFEDELQLVFFHPKYQFRDGQVVWYGVAAILWCDVVWYCVGCYAVLGWVILDVMLSAPQ